MLQEVKSQSRYAFFALIAPLKQDSLRADCRGASKPGQL